MSARSDRSGPAPGREIRVAVNLCWLVPGRVGGSEQYLVRQLRGLSGLGDQGISTTVFGTVELAAAYPDLDVVTMPMRRDWRPGRIAIEHSWLAHRTRSFDLVHHGGGTLPYVGPSPTLLTIHDLQYLRYPEYFGALRRRYLTTTMPRSARTATMIAVPSQYVSSTVLDAFAVAADRVRVVPHGVPELATPSDTAVAEACRRYGVTRPYVVYPAITHPHKGHRVLVDLLEHAPDVALLLTGSPGVAEDEVRSAIAASGHASRIVRAGWVPAADRDALVAGAEALVFPSEYEGFGAPLVEAMSLGTPVVASAASAVVEVVGDAAVVVGTPTGEAWASGLEAARRRRDEMIERGRRRRLAYTPARSGEALADAYRTAVGADLRRGDEPDDVVS